MVEWITRESSEALVADLANTLVAALVGSIAKRGVASLVVSGGSTPAALFRVLSQKDLEWSKVMVTLADERWVDGQSADSNTRMVKDILLQGRAAEAQLIELYSGDDTPEQGLDWAERSVLQMARPFDVVLLGMGNDGHTASLFPEGSALAEGLDLSTPRPVVPMRAPGAAQPRITLTAPVLLDAQRVVVLLVGGQKRAVMDDALSVGPIPSEQDVFHMPIRRFLFQNQTSVDIWWAEA